jgi:3-hydroxyisobutyrate dehydrogenase/2-hydroxy-3-oxopropionate reductase
MNDKHLSPPLATAPGHIHVPAGDRTRPFDRTIAVIGTGKMGSAIAARLSAAGFEVVVWNRTRSRAEALGIGTVAATPAAAARDADIVISSLTGPEAVMAAYLGPDGVLSVGEGKHFVEMSTAGPDLVSELAAHVEAAHGTLVDAPILGAPPLVRAGEAAILVGGADEVVTEISPVLSVLGTVRHTGPLGTAARLKLVANSMLADVVLAAAELQVAGEAAGLGPEEVFWVLQRIAPALGARRAGFIENRHTPPMFALRDLRKDLDLALTLFGRSAAETPLTRSSSDVISAEAAVSPDLDISAVTRPYRQIGRSHRRDGTSVTETAAAHGAAR